ncbi:MAG: acylneuraminate cytidylyltransferase family protein [Roseibium sp.]
MEQVVAIIPARGGSKGIPGKNIKPFLGVPLVAHSIQAALGAETVSNVIVSSDDDAILNVADDYGALALKRPLGISGDEASTESAVLHALATVEVCQAADTVVFLQCTAPLTTSAEIDQVVRSLTETNADTAFSVVDVHAFLWEIASDGSGVGVNHDATKPRQRRQDRNKEYRETGAIYALRKDAFIEAGERFFGRSVPVVLPNAVEIDLDTPRDWALLEAYADMT